jgi:ribosomal protein L20A (L18A)
MNKRKTPKAWVAYRLARIGKRLGVVHADSEEEALEEAYQRFGAKRQAERMRIYLRAVTRSVT